MLAFVGVETGAVVRVGMSKRQLGTVLLVLGLLVWPLGWWVLPLFGVDLPTVPHLLAAHLAGVVPGVMLRGSKILSWLRKQG